MIGVDGNREWSKETGRHVSLRWSLRRPAGRLQVRGAILWRMAVATTRDCASSALSPFHTELRSSHS